MAERLARIYGTEQDRVNCPFYAKMGACRHGDRCSRLHHKPSFSPTMLLGNMYQNPKAQGAEMLNIDEGVASAAAAWWLIGRCSSCSSSTSRNSTRCSPPRPASAEPAAQDVHGELSEFGLIEEMHVVDNIGDHMVGNVYVMFDDEEGCARALTALNGRFYAGRPIMAEFSPVTDFHEARCRQYDEAICNRGGHCNFMHIKPLSRGLRKKLGCNRSGGKEQKRSRSRSPRRDSRRDDRRDDRRDRDRDDRRRDRDDRDDRRRDRGDDRDDRRRDRGDDRDDRRRDRGDDRRDDRREDRGRDERREREGERREEPRERREEPPPASHPPPAQY